MINHYLSFNKKKLILKKKTINFAKSDFVIKVKSCGICGSDLHILKNGSNRVTDGRIMGHEISGQIIEKSKNKGNIRNVLFGADIPNRKRSDYALGHEIDGGFQKYLIIKKNLFKKIPHFITKRKIDFDEASLCEPLACCLNGFKNMNFRKNKNVIIFGAGPIGQLLALICVYKKAKEIFIIDQNNKKLKLGSKNNKINKLHTRDLDKLLKKNKKFDYGFVACSSSKAQNEILKYMKKDSVVNYFAGIKKKGNKLVPINTNLIHYNQIKIVGSHGSTKKDIVKSAKLIIEKKIDLSGIITKSYDIHNYKKAFNDLKNGKSLKAVIKP